MEPALIQIPLQLPDGSRPEPMQLGEVIKQQYALGLTVTQPLYAGGSLTHGRKAAQAGVLSSEAQRDGTQASLWLSLSSAWYGFAVAQEVVAIQERRLEAAKTREQGLVRLLAKGRATKLQLSAVALKRAEAKNALVSAELSAVMAQQALQALTGEAKIPRPVNVLKRAQQLAVAAPSTGRPPTLREAQAKAVAAEAMAGVSAGRLLPTVALRLGAQYANPNPRNFPAKAEWACSWDASVVVSWTLDAGVRSYEAKSADHKSNAARLAVTVLGEARRFGTQAGPFFGHFGRGAARRGRRADSPGKGRSACH